MHLSEHSITKLHPQPSPKLPQGSDLDLAPFFIFNVSIDCYKCHSALLYLHATCLINAFVPTHPHIPQAAVCHLEMCGSIFTWLKAVQLSFCSELHHDQKILSTARLFLDVLRSVPQPRRCSLWPKSHQHLRRPWILLFGWAVTDMSVRPCWLTVLF